MKILYFGTVCDLTKYENMLADCDVKPSIATIVFETSLLTGFSENISDKEFMILDKIFPGL